MHTFEEPGVYTVTLTITDEDGGTGCATLPVSVDRNSKDPVVKFGFADGDYPKVTLHGGKVTRSPDGSYDLGSGKPFTWIKVGERPIGELDAARSFTIAGWLKASGMKVGSGGNRVLFSLQHNHAGIDLVHHADGAMRLAVNEWPDKVRNDSSPGQIRAKQWTFFAVTYDATGRAQNVRWYFGGAGKQARLDRTTSYFRGPTGAGSGALTIGNYNETIHRHGLDRQFRGRIRGLMIFGSRATARGALSAAQIRKYQK